MTKYLLPLIIIIRVIYKFKLAKLKANISQILKALCTVFGITETTKLLKQVKINEERHTCARTVDSGLGVGTPTIVVTSYRYIQTGKCFAKQYRYLAAYGFLISSVCF